MTRTPHRLNLLIGIMGLSIDVVVPHSANIRRKEQARMIKDFENGQCGQKTSCSKEGKEARDGGGHGGGRGRRGNAARPRAPALYIPLSRQAYCLARARQGLELRGYGLRLTPCAAVCRCTPLVWH